MNVLVLVLQPYVENATTLSDVYIYTYHPTSDIVQFFFLSLSITLAILFYHIGYYGAIERHNQGNLRWIQS